MKNKLFKYFTGITQNDLNIISDYYNRSSLLCFILRIFILTLKLKKYLCFDIGFDLNLF